MPLFADAEAQKAMPSFGWRALFAAGFAGGFVLLSFLRRPVLSVFFQSTGFLKIRLGDPAKATALFDRAQRVLPRLRALVRANLRRNRQWCNRSHAQSR